MSQTLENTQNTNLRKNVWHKENCINVKVLSSLAFLDSFVLQGAWVDNKDSMQAEIRVLADNGDTELLCHSYQLVVSKAISLQYCHTMSLDGGHKNVQQQWWEQLKQTN